MMPRDKLHDQRAARLAADAALARELTRRYGTAWGKIKTRLNLLLDELEQARERGETIDAGWLAQHQISERLEQVSGVELRAYADLAKRTIDKATLRSFLAGAIDANTLLQSTLSKRLGWTPALPVRETAEIARASRLGTPLGDLLESLGTDTHRIAREKLVEGVALGKNPIDIGRDLRESFAGNQVRALRVARTETTDAYRRAAIRATRVARTEVLGAYRRTAVGGYRGANDVVGEWVWVAELGSACPVCVAMHGTIHDLDEEMDSHPSCRCSPAPRTKSWAELGFEGVPETRLDLETGEDWFARQPEAAQRRTLGPSKYAAYKDGRLKLADLVQPTVDPVWGRGLRERSLRDALTVSA